MVDLRKLHDKLREVCEEKIECKAGVISAIDLNEKIDKALDNLNNGISELEEDVKKLVGDTESLKEGIEDVANSLY